MTAAAKEELLQKKKERLARLKKQIKSDRNALSRAKRKERDTALFTVGATFAALLRDPATQDVAEGIWDQHLAHQAPKMMTDSRRFALKSQFGLEPKEQ